MKCTTLKRHLLWIVSLALLMPIFAFALADAASSTETATNDSLAQLVRELQDRVNELEQDVFSLRAQAGSSVMDNESMVASRREIGILPRTPGDHPGNAVLIPLPESNVLAGQATDGIEISGFMDGIYEVNPKHNRENSAYLNQVEIDLAKGLSDRAEVALGVAFDESFTIGVATMSYSLIRNESEDEDASPFFGNWTATAGQFDVPFGLDYHKYASVDRLTVTQPLICEQSHGGWNDIGLLNTLETEIGSLDAWVVKGIDSRIWDSAEEVPEDVADDDPRWTDVPSQVSGGMQLNVSPIADVDFGCSVTRGWSEERSPAFSLIGLHAQGGWKNSSIKTEFIRAVKAEMTAPQVTRGFYVEVLQAFDPVFVIGRVDYVEDAKADIMHYYSAGGGVMITEGLEWRTEYQMHSETHEGRVLFQVVAGF